MEKEDGRYLANVEKGLQVLILNSLNNEVKGIVNDIAPGKEFVEKGIMVRLSNGEVGRIKKIYLAEVEKKNVESVKLKKLIDKGENLHMEFKSSCFWSSRLKNEEIKNAKSYDIKIYGKKASRIIIAKSIAAFLNSDGGNLLVGVREDKETGKYEIKGIERDMESAQVKDLDSYKRIIIDEIIRSFFPASIYNHLDYYVDFEFIELDDKKILNIKVKRSDIKVFLRVSGKEIFMIRVNSENRTLEGEKLVDYCIKHWRR